MHILAVNKTKLDNEINDYLLEIEGDTLHRGDRNRNGRVVAMYVCNSLKRTSKNGHT